MKIVIATGNQGKLREFSRILAPLGYTVISQVEAGFIDEVDETGTTFEENAYLKAAAVHKATGLPVIADDSGLVVEALNGEPGVYSARYAGEDATDGQNNQKLLSKLKGIENRTAWFLCVICYIDKNGKRWFASGSVEGKIIDTPRGDMGFGYDPLFLVGNKTFGEMSAELKDQISHRGMAVKRLLEILTNIDEGTK